MDENEKKAKEDRRKKRKEYVEKIKARATCSLHHGCPLHRSWFTAPSLPVSTLGGNLHERGEDHGAKPLARCAGHARESFQDRQNMWHKRCEHFVRMLCVTTSTSSGSRSLRP